MAYLLLQRGKPVSRQHLAFLFWPETSEGQARTNLRNLLHRLRKALPAKPAYLNTDETHIQWRSDIPYFFDVAEFEAAVFQVESASKTAQTELLQKALGLYGGDLLPDCYSDWLLSERERLRQLHLATIKKLAELFESQRAYSEARAKIQYLLRLEPLDENSYAWLMRLHSLEGNRGEALHVYHTCAEVMNRELGVDPGPRLRLLYEQLLESPTPVASVPPATNLVARQAEWEALTRAWRELIGGKRTMQVFLITGEAGIGKTHLARAFIDWVQRQGNLTAKAVCYETGQGLAYAPLAAWLADLFKQDERTFDRLARLWKSEVCRILPELRIRFPDLDRSPAFAEKWQLLHFFESLHQAFNVQRAPVLLFIDDIQWCDAETLEWLVYLQSRPLDQKIAIIATARSEALPGAHLAMQVVNSSDQTNFIELQPLDNAETRRLLEQLTGKQIDANLAEKIYLLSEGNPLFATEMARAGLDRYLSQSTPLPERIQSVIAWRLSQLSSSARQIIDLASVIGRSLSYALLLTASGLDEGTLVDGIDEAWRQRILREQASQNYDFSHDRIRQVVYEGLSQARKRLGHQQVAAALEVIHSGNLNLAAEQIAYHLELSGQTDRAVMFYELAAQAAHRLFALSHAIKHYEKALQLLGSKKNANPLAAGLYEQLGVALFTSGQYAAARQTLASALECLEAEDRISHARLHRRIALTWSSQQFYDKTGQAIEDALATLGEQPPAGLETAWMQEWLETRLQQVDFLYFQNQPDQMQLICDQMEAPLGLYGTVGQQAEFYTLRSMQANRRQRFYLTEQTVQFVQRGLELAKQMGDPLIIARKRFALGFNLLWYGDRPAAIEQLNQALALAEQIGATFVQDQALAYLTICYRMNGDQELVSQFARRALSLAKAESHPNYQGSALSNLAWLAFHQGDLPEAKRLGESARPLLGNTKYPFLWLANFPLAAVAVRLCDAQSALERLAEILSPYQQRLPEELEVSLKYAIAQFGEVGPAAGLEAARQALEIASRLRYL